MTFTRQGEPSLDDLRRMAERSLAALPAPFVAGLDGVAIRVLELPDGTMLEQVGASNPMGLLGLYSGVPFGRRSIGAVAQHVDSIYLFRRPILAYSRQGGFALEDVVHHVLIHEIGHHFGLSDADMMRIERSAD